MRPVRGIDVGALRLLAAIRSHTSLSAAARELGVTQQTASERLRHLEAETGLDLVWRSSAGSTLTPAGALLLTWGHDLLITTQETELAIASLRGQPRGVSQDSPRIHLQTSLANMLPRLLGEQQRRAALDVDRTPVPAWVVGPPADVLAAVRGSTADFAVLEGPPRRGLRSSVLSSDELVLVIAPDTPLARRGGPLTVVDIAGLELTSTPVGTPARDALDRMLHARRVPSTRTAVVAASSAEARSRVVDGGAPAFLPRCQVRRDIATGRLIPVPVNDFTPALTVRITWRREAPGPRRWLIDLLTTASREA